MANITATPSLAFHLSTPTLSYAFHISPSLELIQDHFGAPLTSPLPLPPLTSGGWSNQPSNLARAKRELPDTGRGDFRIPAVVIRHPKGDTVSHFKYSSYTILPGKPPLSGLPSTHGPPSAVSTLIIHLIDEINLISIDLSYSIFPAHSAIARSMRITNNGEEKVVVEQAASWSTDLEGEWDMVQLSGDWAREAQIVRRKIYPGTQGISSLTGFSSHHHSPTLLLLPPNQPLSSPGPSYLFTLLHTGSHSCLTELSPSHLTRVQLGVNPAHLAWGLAPGETFVTPECVGVYSEQGVGGGSRGMHGLFKGHLVRSGWGGRERPVLLNNWEATYFDFTADKLTAIAEKAATLGVKLFVMDDGWFGVAHPRVSDSAGLGDWVVNPARFPEGLGRFVEGVNGMTPGGGGKGGMKFGIWVEPEMVNPVSELYEQHPDWVLHCGKHERTETRNQLVLNLALMEVQEYLIDSLTTLLRSANIEYVKWDCNRGMHELPSPSTGHAYILGLYRVLEVLTTRFSQVLWEGCASGGGRFDAGMLYYFPQSWTSDNTDALDRLFIQFGTSMIFPASSMGGHVSAVPNHQTGRVTPLRFRAHVAMMCGSFGFELDLATLPASEQTEIPGLIALAERVNPIVVKGEMYRLLLPTESNWPAVLFLMPDGSEGVLLVYQMKGRIGEYAPAVRLQGLEGGAEYEVEVVGGEKGRRGGGDLMGQGVRVGMKGDYGSGVVFLKRV